MHSKIAKVIREGTVRVVCAVNLKHIIVPTVVPMEILGLVLRGRLTVAVEEPVTARKARCLGLWGRNLKNGLTVELQMAASVNSNLSDEHPMKDYLSSSNLVFFACLKVFAFSGLVTAGGSKTLQAYQNREGRWGFKQGQRIVVTAKYDSVDEFSEGLATVMVTDHAILGPYRDKWGYISVDGKILIPLQYALAFSFSEGLGLVSTGDSWLYIDKTGGVVITLHGPCLPSPFSEGLAAVQYESGTEYINHNGNVVFSIKHTGEPFSEGLAAYFDETVQKYGYISRRGITVREPVFSEATRFSCGLAAVRSQKADVKEGIKLWGFINYSGRLVIPFRYNAVEPFKDYKAKVHIGGEEEIPDDGNPNWVGGRWVTIDANGSEIEE